MSKQTQMIPVNYDILPVDIERAINTAKMQRAALDRFLKDVLVSGVDYDRVPGTDKPTLLKSGAELLCQLFRISPGKLEVLNVERDMEKSFLSYDVGMYIIHRESGLQVAYGIGAANSYEKKYRWRNSKDIEGNDVKIQNPDIMDQHNTLLKMAAKRALVDGVLKATGASRLFTQDMEDMGLPPEAASKKQVDLMKKIFKGMTEQEMLSKVSETLGREVSEWSDIGRKDASEVIDKNKPESWGKGKGNDQNNHGNSNSGNGGNAINYGAFWDSAKNLGFNEDQVKDVAREIFNKPELQSLTEVVTSQQQLSSLLGQLSKRKAATGGAA